MKKLTFIALIVLIVSSCSNAKENVGTYKAEGKQHYIVYDNSSNLYFIDVNPYTDEEMFVIFTQEQLKEFNQQANKARNKYVQLEKLRSISGLEKFSLFLGHDCNCTILFKNSSWYEDKYGTIDFAFIKPKLGIPSKLCIASKNGVYDYKARVKSGGFSIVFNSLEEFDDFVKALDIER